MDRNNTRESFIVCGGIVLSFVLILFPDISFAGTGGEELQGVYDKTVAIAQGYGGKTVAVLAFLGAMLGAIKGNLVGFITPLGISIAAGVGPSMVTSGISALI